MATNKERFLTALAGNRPDRTPLAHVAAMTTVGLQEATGCFMPDVHRRPEALARLEMIADTGVTCFNFDWAIRPDVMKQAAQGRFSIMGNIISPGCAVSPTCPNESLEAMARIIQSRHNK